MTLPPDSPPPDPPIVPEDSLPTGEPIHLPPARRRRARRTLSLPGADERARLVETLGRRAFPAFEFFLFSLLGGAILGAGYLLDSHSLLLLGILLAPLMTPWVGLTLATVTGSWRFFFLTLASLLFGGLLIFLGGALAGLAALGLPPRSMVQASIQSHLWWPNLFVLSIGAVLLVISFVRSEEKPLLASVMMAYELYLPLSAAGFGLGRGAEEVWPNGLLVFLFHFALAVLLGAITLAALRFRPRAFLGYLLPVSAGLTSLLLIFLLSGLGNVLAGFFSPPAVVLPTQIPTPLTAAFWTPTPSATTLPPTFTPSMTPAVTFTPSQTPTPRPTPIYARIHSGADDGALVRSEAGTGHGYVVITLINDYLVEILPDPPVTVNGVVWVHIRTMDGVEGWVLQSVLALATPVPTQTP